MQFCADILHQACLNSKNEEYALPAFVELVESVVCWVSSVGPVIIDVPRMMTVDAIEFVEK